MWGGTKCKAQASAVCSRAYLVYTDFTSDFKKRKTLHTWYVGRGAVRKGASGCFVGSRRGSAGGNEHAQERKGAIAAPLHARALSLLVECSVSCAFEPQCDKCEPCVNPRGCGENLFASLIRTIVGIFFLKVCTSFLARIWVHATRAMS